MHKRIPWLLIYLRLALCPVAVLFGVYQFLGLPYILLMAIAAASDYFDGKLARKWNVETASLRQWDSIADTIFFLGVLAGMWAAYPTVYAKYMYGIYSIIGLEACRYIFDLIKFRRGASYHAISAKTFGVTLLVATIAIMGFGSAEPFFPVAIVAGMISELEGLVMSFVLLEWSYNVRHIGIAINLRQQHKQNRQNRLPKK
jgi:CDP-diacylglycerol--glycerol-3-phosphate 3-phosphatidyltransferase